MFPIWMPASPSAMASTTFLTRPLACSARSQATASACRGWRGRASAVSVASIAGFCRSVYGGTGTPQNISGEAV